MIGRVLDLFYPRRCEICGGETDRPGSHVCMECLDRIPFIPASGVCRVCSLQVAGARDDFVCSECSGRRKPHFDMAVCAVRYEDSIKELVHSYKIGGRIHLKTDFAEWMLAAAGARFDTADVDAVLPMPATLFHRIDRGYNPSAYLAKAVAKSIDRRYVGNAVVRKGFPRRQAGLDEESRRENVKGTFLVLRPELVRSRTILLVDDVSTTGSTLSECALALKQAGAWRVWCLALARAVR